MISKPIYFVLVIVFLFHIRVLAQDRSEQVDISELQAWTIKGLDKSEYNFQCNDSFPGTISINLDTKLNYKSKPKSISNQILVDRNRGRVIIECIFETKDLSHNASVGLFCQLFDSTGSSVAFDNMQDRLRYSNKHPDTGRIEIYFNKPISRIGFGIYVNGNGKLKAKNISVVIDSGEFSHAWQSKYVDELASNTIAIKGLATLGRVWGFLKYNHPQVGLGELDWDSVLVQNIKAITNLTSIDNSKLNQILYRLINLPQKIERCDACSRNVPDSLALNYDKNWPLNDPILDTLNINLLEFIENNRKSQASVYIQKDTTTGSPIFEDEKTYKFMVLPNVEYRLLALFRYWNIIHYFFPYKYTMDEDWDNKLEYFVPFFIKARTTYDYKMAVLQLAATIDDSHAYQPLQLRQLLINRNPSRIIPIQFRILNKKMLISEIDSSFARNTGLKKGDEVIRLQDKSLQEITECVGRYISSSTIPGKFEAISHLLPYTNDSILSLTYYQNFEKVTVVDTLKTGSYINFISKLLRDFSPANVEASYKALNDSVVYIDIGQVRNEDIDDIKFLLSDPIITKVIVDCRDYPRDDVFSLVNYFVKDGLPFIKFNTIDLKHPGMLSPPIIGYTSNKGEVFKGQLVVLIDRTTISQGEFYTMLLQKAYDCTIIGRPSAGSNGNVSTVSLPGNLEVQFSGVRVTYPNGKETQRIGIIPDIVVPPSILDIKNNVDSILETAIRYVTN